MSGESKQFGAINWLKPSERLKLAAKLREMWAADPKLTIERVRELTGAPQAMVQQIRARLIAAGVVKVDKLGRAG